MTGYTFLSDDQKGYPMGLTGRLLYLILLRAFCICGFLWQVTEVAQTFFSYKTTSKVLLNSHESNILPTLQLCMLYTDIMDFDRLNRNEGTSFKRSSEFQEIADTLANLTLKQITPCSWDQRYYHQLHISQS